MTSSSIRTCQAWCNDGAGMIASNAEPTIAAPLSNADVAERLEDVANLLQEQGGNQFRVQAWRGGAATIRHLARSVRELLDEEGLEGLDRLPGIGPGLARAVRQLIETGRLATLERLRGESDPVALLASVPAIGHTFAKRIHDRLGIESLEELELAAHDGRLASLSGMGPKRLAGIRDALTTRLRSRWRDGRHDTTPDVAELLDVDREYRERGLAGELPRSLLGGSIRWASVGFPYCTRRAETGTTPLSFPTPLPRTGSIACATGSLSTGTAATASGSAPW